jgi:hypothetical protein
MAACSGGPPIVRRRFAAWDCGVGVLGGEQGSFLLVPFAGDGINTTTITWLCGVPPPRLLLVGVLLVAGARYPVPCRRGGYACYTWLS